MVALGAGGWAALVVRDADALLMNGASQNWKKIQAKPMSAIFIFSLMLVVCAICGFGLAYIIWDPATALSECIKIGLFMTGVQVFYWVVNFLTLYLLDFKSFKKAKPEAETE